MEPQYLYLTTTGWKTNQPHEIEIWFVEYQGAYYLCSERREKSHWVQNIQHHPAVRFRVGRETFEGKGRVVQEPALLTAAAALMEQKYNWNEGLFVELKPNTV